VLTICFEVATVAFYEVRGRSDLAAPFCFYVARHDERGISPTGAHPDVTASNPFMADLFRFPSCANLSYSTSLHDGSN